MKTKIFIEYENTLLTNLAKKLYDLFLENNYDVILLDNTLSLNEKEKIINDNKGIVISNKLNNNNFFELVYSLKNTNELALAINNSLIKNYIVSKYYQKRDFTNTSLDYYKILRNNNESIIIFYPQNDYSNISIINDIYNGIIDYLNEENIYIIKSGDSLYAIARKFNTTVDEIKRINKLSSNLLSIGQKLIIPKINNEKQENNPIQENIYIVKSGDSLYAIARKYNTTVDEIKRINKLSSNLLSIGQKLIIPSSNIIYIVKSGDTLYSIAKKYNINVDEIKKKNNLINNILSIGQKLLLP